MRPFNNLLLIGITLLFCLPLKAQYLVGGGLNYNVDVKRFGFFLRGAAPVDSLWRAAGTFNLFLENGSKATRLEFAVDAHHFFWANDRFRSYLIGGLNLYHEHFSTRGRDTNPPPPVRRNHVGVNLGIGLQTEINDRITPFGEMKVSVGDGSLFGVFVGMYYRLPTK